MSQRWSASQGQPVDEEKRTQEPGIIDTVEDMFGAKDAKEGGQQPENERDHQVHLISISIGVLFTAITYFITYIQPQFQQNSADFTVSLLRVLIYATNSTLLGGGPPPPIPVWSGPPRAIKNIRTILYSCLASTILAGLVAMLTKFAPVPPPGSRKKKYVDWVLRADYGIAYAFLAAAFILLAVAIISLGLFSTSDLQIF